MTGGIEGDPFSILSPAENKDQYLNYYDYYLREDQPIMPEKEE